MPRTTKIASALALALAGIGTASAQEFTAVISFGDSLSDAGNYAPYIPGSGSFTTNPDDVWAQVLAEAFGLSQTPYTAGGTNYAFGGAPTSFSIPPIPLPLSCVPAALPCLSVSQQIGTYLASTGGVADPNALYTYWAGANDLFNYLQWAGPQLINPGPPPVYGPPLITPTQAQLFAGATALVAGAQLNALQDAGANYIVVLNLPDIGQAPQFLGTGQTSLFVSSLVYAYNTTLNDQLALLDDGIIPINAYALFNEVLADPSLYGFSNVTDEACTVASSLFCTPSTLVSSGANQSYLFADGVHPSGAAHAMLASVVVATIQAPGQVAMAAEIPLAVYETQSHLINRNIFVASSRDRAKGDVAVYGRLQYARNDFDATANTGAFDSNLASASLGADVNASDGVQLGGAVTFGSTSGDGARSAIDAKEVLATAYGVGHFGIGYINLLLSGGTSHFDIDRTIPIGAANRVETGSTNARHLAAEVGGGLTFGNDSFRHGPFISVEWQQVRVQDYREEGLDSTSMWFNDFERESTIGRIGYRLEGTAGNLHPFGRIAYAKQNDNDPTSVQAGSNTMNGHFTFFGFTPSEDWVEADVGLGWKISDQTDLSVSYRARLNDDYQDWDALALDFRMEFGAVAPAPVEEVVAEPAKTCADLDDDGDGVDNCEDKCPATPAGEAIGPDGCPVPAPEPEVMEPKPYRN
jgi:outer membrane lipase/esterase